jgi:hypothetical protein
MCVGIPRALVLSKQKRAGVNPLTTFGRDVQTVPSLLQVELHKNEVCDEGEGGGGQSTAAIPRCVGASSRATAYR